MFLCGNWAIGQFELFLCGNWAMIYFLPQPILYSRVDWIVVFVLPDNLSEIGVEYVEVAIYIYMFCSSLVYFVVRSMA